MNLFKFISLSFSFCMIALFSNAQNHETKEVISLLEKKYDVRFNYDNSILGEIELTDFQTHDKTLITILSELFPENGNIRFEVQDKDVLLYKKQKKENKRLISGFILDAETLEKLPFATVSINGENRGVVSNKEGFFSFDKAVNDSSTLSISYLGYLPKSLKVKNISGDNFFLNTSPDQLKEVVIDAKTREEVEVNPIIGSTGINSKLLAVFSAFGEEDVFNTLQFVPGVFNSSESVSNLVVRGSTTDQSLVLFDDFTVYHLDHFFGVFSAFNSQVLKDIRLYKGGYPSKYGGKVAGLLDLTSKSGNQNAFTGSVNLNLLSASSAIEIPLGKKVSLLVAGRRSFTDVFQSYLYDDLIDVAYQSNEQVFGTAVNSSDPDFRFYDFNTKLSWRPSDRDALYFSVYGGNDLLEYTDDIVFSQQPYRYETNEKTNWGNLGQSIRYNKLWKNRNYTEFTFGLSQYYRDFERKSTTWNSGVPHILNYNDKNDISDYNFKVSHETPLSDKHKLEGGLYYIYNSINYKNFNFGNLNELELNLTGYRLGSYISCNSRFGKLTLLPGVRFTYFDAAKKIYIEPRINAKVNLSKAISLNASYGLYNQFVSQVKSSDPYTGQDDFWVLRGDQNTPILNSEQFAIGFLLKTGGNTLSAEVYRKEVNGLAQHFADINEGDFNTKEIIIGDGEYLGLDLMLSKSWINYSILAGYTYSVSNNQFSNLNNSEAFPDDNDMRHQFKFSTTGSWKKLRLGINWFYNTGKPYSSDVTEVNNARMPNYHRLDLNLIYDIKLGNGTLSLNAHVINLYDRKNLKSINLVNFIAESELNDPNNLLQTIELPGITPCLSIKYKFKSSGR